MRVQRRKLPVFGGVRSGGHLPFSLAREAFPSPGRISGRLVKAYMGHGFVFPYGPAAIKRVGHPDGAILLPVSGRFPAVLTDGIPSVRQPEFGAAIAPISNEIEKLADAYRPVGNFRIVQKDTVFGTFVVEGEALSGVADRVKPGCNLVPAEFGSGIVRGGIALWMLINRVGRVQRKGVLDVGEQEFLMLLLVIQSKLDQASRFGRTLVHEA